MKRSLFYLTWCLFFISLPLASTGQTVKPAEIAKHQLGQAKNVHKSGDLFFAGQFTRNDVEKIKQEKIDRVINLRTAGEIDWDEKAVIEAAGLEYVAVPFRHPETLNDEVFDKIRKLLGEPKKVTLFHCGSANRVAGVWLPYRVLDQGVALETALQEAKEIGLRTKFIEEKALDYIKRFQQEQAEKKSSSEKEKAKYSG